MRASKAHQDLVDHRRARVSQLRLERRTEREIAAVLAEEGFRNPETEEPWSIFTVHADCVAVATRWRREQSANEAQLKAELWAAIRHAQRRAWETGDVPTVLRALKQEAELLGLDAPAKIDVEAHVRFLAAREGLDPEEAVEEARRVLRDARA